MVYSIFESLVTEVTRNKQSIAHPGPKDETEQLEEELKQNMVTALYLMIIAYNVCRQVRF